MKRSLRYASTLVAIAAVTVSAASGTADAAQRFGPTAPTRIETTTLPEKSLLLGDAAFDSAGNFWAATKLWLRREPGYQSGGNRWDTVLTRISPDSDVQQFGPPPKTGVSEIEDSTNSAITKGPDGMIWMVTREALVRVSHGGETTVFPLAKAALAYPKIVGGPGGSVWVMDTAYSETKLMRFSTSGDLQNTYVLGTILRSVVAGPGDALWASAPAEGAIYRISTDGQAVRFPTPALTYGITVGPDRNLWFLTATGIARMTPAGRVRQFEVPQSESFFRVRSVISAGPDGRVWFEAEDGLLGRITTDGKMSKVALPDDQMTVQGLTPGPEGRLWFAADDGPCEGGPSTCAVYLPTRPGTVGSIEILPPMLRVLRAKPAGAGQARLALSCQGGVAGRICTGRIDLRATVGGKRRTIGSRRIRVGTDRVVRVGVPLSAGARGKLQRAGSLNVNAVVHYNGKLTAARVKISLAG